MYIILALLLAILFSAFQYLYKRKALLFFVIRSLVYFAVLLLLLNLKVTQKKETITHPDFYVLVDNSQSIKTQNVDNQLLLMLDSLKKSGLYKKFNTHFFKFSKSLQSFDSLNFEGKQTDIAAVLTELNDLNSSEHTTPVILLSDGISSIGNDYLNIQNFGNLQIFPLVVGDTTKYNDVKIDLLNVNSYAYKGNKFPVEIFTSYKGKLPAKVVLQILQKNRVVFKKSLSFDRKNSAIRVETLLPANQKGLHRYTVRLSSLKNEKNTLNNSRSFVIEVIDNAQKILLISDIIHPDLGAIRRSLSTNKYLQINIVKPHDKIADFNRYHSFILYQPTAKFAEIFNRIKARNKSWFVVTGKHTDWNFINSQKLFFFKKATTATEYYVPVENPDFSLFKLPELDIKDFPPLVDYYGKVDFNDPVAVAYKAKIKGIVTQQPILAFCTQKKQAVLLGENIWQWSMQAGLEKQSEAFSGLLQQLVQYLSIDNNLQRLKINYKRNYYQGEKIVISAQFLNNNLETDDKEKPVLIVHTASGQQKFPMSYQNGFFETDLSQLPAGNYRFTVANSKHSLSKSGLFKVLPYQIEDKNLTVPVQKLQELAQRTNGKVFFSNQIKSLIQVLQQKGKYPSISKVRVRKVPVINYKYLLFFIVLLLAIEWLLKKLRGEL